MKKRSVLHKIVCLLLPLLLVQPLPAAAEENLIGGKDSGIINLLLIGRDSREEEMSRSDCIMLCTLHPESKTVAITSILRDLYVPIPGHGSNRINAAYAFGGTPLLRQTLREDFDLSIDGCVEVDFSSFPQIIDALGGVSIELRQDEAEVINSIVEGDLTEGTHTLTGAQALAYSRIRKLDRDGDFSRTNRQRKVISSLLDSYRSASLLTVLNVVVDTLPMLSTDLSKKQVLVLAAKLFPLLDDPTVMNQRIPADGTFTCQRIDGMDVLVANLEENKDFLRDTLLSINSSNK